MLRSVRNPFALNALLRVLDHVESRVFVVGGLSTVKQALEPAWAQLAHRCRLVAQCGERPSAYESFR